MWSLLRIPIFACAGKGFQGLTTRIWGLAAKRLNLTRNIPVFSPRQLPARVRILTGRCFARKTGKAPKPTKYALADP